MSPGMWCFVLSSALKALAAESLKKLLTCYHITRRHIPKEGDLRIQRVGLLTYFKKYNITESFTILFTQIKFPSYPGVKVSEFLCVLTATFGTWNHISFNAKFWISSNPSLLVDFHVDGTEPSRNHKVTEVLMKQSKYFFREDVTPFLTGYILS